MVLCSSVHVRAMGGQTQSDSDIWAQWNSGVDDDFSLCTLDTLCRSTLGFPVQENSVEVQVG